MVLPNSDRHSSIPISTPQPELYLLHFIPHSNPLAFHAPTVGWALLNPHWCTHTSIRCTSISFDTLHPMLALLAFHAFLSAAKKLLNCLWHTLVCIHTPLFHSGLLFHLLLSPWLPCTSHLCFSPYAGGSPPFTGIHHIAFQTPF